MNTYKDKKKRKWNAFQKAKERRKQRKRSEEESKGFAGGMREHEKRQPTIPTEPDMDLPNISKEVLVFEMQRAGFTDLDIKEQTGLSWDEIKRIKAGGKREYQRLIDEHIKKLFWQIYQQGYEEAENEAKTEQM